MGNDEQSVIDWSEQGESGLSFYVLVKAVEDCCSALGESKY